MSKNTKEVVDNLKKQAAIPVMTTSFNLTTKQSADNLNVGKWEADGDPKYHLWKNQYENTDRSGIILNISYDYDQGVQSLYNKHYGSLYMLVKLNTNCKQYHDCISNIYARFKLTANHLGVIQLSVEKSDQGIMRIAQFFDYLHNQVEKIGPEKIYNYMISSFHEIKMYLFFHDVVEAANPREASLEKLQKLFKKSDANANITEFRYCGPCLLYSCIAARGNNTNLDVIKYLVEEQGAKVEGLGSYYDTPIKATEIFRNLAIKEYLMSKGAKEFGSFQEYQLLQTNDTNSSNLESSKKSKP